VIHQAVNGAWTRDYAYDALSPIESTRRANRLTSTTIGSVNPIVEPFTYDAHGNVTSTAHLPALQWDFWNRLEATTRQIVSSGAAETTRYAYDAKGQRVRKVALRGDGSRKNERTYVGGFEVYREFDSTGDTVVLERQTLHVADDAGRIALVEHRTHGSDGSPAEIVRYQFGNQIGSCSLELDAGADVISYEEYTPYGSTSYQAVRGQTAAPKRYRYSAMERDEESGFSYHGARYYAPWLGKWISPDPLQDDYPRWEPYSYAFDNPLRFNDPSGLGPETGAEKYMRRLANDAIRDSNVAVETLSDIKRQLKDLNKEVANLRAQGKSEPFIEGKTGGRYSDLNFERNRQLSFAQAQAKTNLSVANQLLEIEKQHLRTLLVDVESQIPIRTPLTDAADNLKQSIRQASALDISAPKPPPPPPKKKPPPEPKAELPEATARFPNEESALKRLWKKLIGGSKKVGQYGPHIFTAIDFWDAYTRISAEDTTYGQVKETSFWGGRLFGAAIGAEYGAAYGPWGMLVGAVLGAIIGENAVKAVFAGVEDFIAEIVSPLTDQFKAGFKALKDPEVQRYITKGVNRMTGMDDINSGFDRMNKEMDRQSRERR
jgi:RHS repeat-associated protein